MAIFRTFYSQKSDIYCESTGDTFRFHSMRLFQCPICLRDLMLRFKHFFHMVADLRSYNFLSGWKRLHNYEKI